MAKLNTLFNEVILAVPTMRFDSAEINFRVDKGIKRTDFLGGLISKGEEVDWFNERSRMEKEWDYQPLEKNDEGFLLGRAVATTIGVFPYLQADGSVRRELRAPEHVYHPDSVASLKMVPITNDHPPGVAVTADNVGQYTVGNVGEEVTADQMHGFISTSVSIQQKKAVQDVEAGKRGLSCGYTTDVVERPGIWGGVAYDAIQTNIRYNHLAIVDEGRAGDDAVLKMDGAMVAEECGGTKRKNEKNKPKKKGDGMDKDIVLDGLTYTVPGHVAITLDKAIAGAKDAEAAKLKADEALVEVTTERDTLQGKFDQSEKEVVELKAKLDDCIPKAEVAAFAAKAQKLDAAVTKSKAVVAEDATDLDKKKAVILAMDAEAKLDSVSEGFIDGAFAMICKKLDTLVEADIANAQVVHDAVVTPVTKKEDKSDAISAELKLKQDLAAKWEK